MKSKVCFITCVLFAGAVHGEIYQWTDAQGRVQFSDIKPPTQSTNDVQEVVIPNGNFVEQDQALRERNREYFDSRQAERERERQVRRAVAAREERFRGLAEAAANQSRQTEEERQIQQMRNSLRRNAPHLLAPRARTAPGVP